MLYLNEEHIRKVPINWDETIGVIIDAVRCLDKNDFSQPVKPYLRFKDLKNRIIAMPAFIGGGFDMAGIKWIASFPNNIQKGIPRAHSVTILNDSNTGKPVCIINTALISILRTVSVSGAIIKSYLKARNKKDLTCGIVGWGPIGQNHYKMLKAVYGDLISEIKVFDINKIDPVVLKNDSKIKITDSWSDAYNGTDIFIACTVSKERYIDLEPKKGSLHLNVSLRDYKSLMLKYFNGAIIVDDWEEVCRENTDIEVFHKEAGLEQSDVIDISKVVVDECLNKINSDNPIMFNPMGMAIFDIAVSSVYYQRACENGIGIKL